ncbi:uncharacterized protein [Venturia canescens]|uniref:uncharacterized protein n=1 Tax=Venturia canescens TaxID=32260 RepID=UPI001C9BDABB|nr:uncharacterized protein LOC122413331 [Venturia canescens]
MGKQDVLAPPFWRDRFGAAILARAVWALERLDARTFWRRRLGAETFWREDVWARGRFGAGTFLLIVEVICGSNLTALQLESEDRRNQWKKALGCELDVKQFVCQFHFSEDSIKKSDRIVLTDGTVYDSPLIRWRLNEGAVPISQQCGPMDCEENNNGIEETEQENSALDVKKEQLQISNSVVLDEGTDTAPSILTESWTEQDVDNVQGAVDAFTLGNLKDDLTAGLLSESWAWTQKSTGLIFTLLDRSNLHPQLHLEVALDLTLSIRTITDTVIPLNEQATSSNDIRRYMKILKNCIICSGTGV